MSIGYLPLNKLHFLSFFLSFPGIVLYIVGDTLVYSVEEVLFLRGLWH
jgi:hypothetical protein